MTQIINCNTIVANAFTGIVSLGVLSAMSAAMGSSFGAVAGMGLGASAISGLSSEEQKILSRSGLGVYKPPPFGAMSKESEKKRKPPESIREREIGPYSVYMEIRKDNVQIRLYHYSEGGKTKRIGAWTGSLAAGESKFEKVAETVHAVRFEEKTQLMR